MLFILKGTVLLNTIISINILFAYNGVFENLIIIASNATEFENFAIKALFMQMTSRF